MYWLHDLSSTIKTLNNHYSINIICERGTVLTANIHYLAEFSQHWGTFWEPERLRNFPEFIPSQSHGKARIQTEAHPFQNLCRESHCMPQFPSLFFWGLLYGLTNASACHIGTHHQEPVALLRPAQVTKGSQVSWLHLLRVRNVFIFCSETLSFVFYSPTVLPLKHTSPTHTFHWP